MATAKKSRTYVRRTLTHPIMIFSDFRNDHMTDDLHKLNINSSSKDDDEFRRKDLYISPIMIFGYKIVLTWRQVGMIGAVFNGVWGGMNLIPYHLAKKEDPTLNGPKYIISYATGAMIVQLTIWILLFIYNIIYKTNGTYDIFDAAALLPKFQYNVIRPGILCGALYSIGNFTSIVAVSYLGQGTGYSLCQLSMIVSGLWGIFYFHEITDVYCRMKWFVSAFTAISGIVLLSFQQQQTPH